MIEIPIPGAESLRVEHLVSDFNGTLAVDGHLLPGVAERLRALGDRLVVHVVTADTFGQAAQALDGLPLTLKVLAQGPHAVVKQRYAEELGSQRCVAIGNGCNDELLLSTAKLSIAVIQGEGAALKSLLMADVVAPDIVTALELLLHPARLSATLRR